MLGGMFKKKEAPTSRTFHVASAEAGHQRHHHDGMAFCDNSVSTSKYTLVNFLPKSLFEQFRRLANVYFLIIIVLLMLGTYTPLFDAPLTPYTTLFPLLVVLAVTMGKEGFEDVKRHIADRETNTSPAEELSLEKPGEFDQVQRQQIRVGRIVRVHDKQEVPADMILLTSSETGGNCYIETSNIDGETNLKIKQAAQTAADGVGTMWKSDPADLFGWRATVECELPNSRIHNFNGVLRHAAEEDRQTPVDQSNLLLRGSSVRNTKWVLGLVVYTGKDTKLVQNSREAPSKLSAVETTVNKMLYLILTAQLVLASVSLACYTVWNRMRRFKIDYTCIESGASENTFYTQNCGTAAEPSSLGMWFTFFCLFNNFVPISLYVTMEMVNYCQAFFIDNDREMYCPEADMPAVARTSNMNGDLASIQYVFSDKTGTLTRNIMEFRRCSVAGTVYGNMDIEGEVPPDKFIIEGRPLEELAQQSKDKTSAAHLFMIVLSVCHTVVLETLDDGSTAYQAESPDEEALVSAAADLGYKFVGRAPGEVHVQIGEGGKPLVFKVLCTIAFTSTRKRMSVIVKTPEGKVLLLTKGADNIVGGRAKEYHSTDKSTVDSHLRLFSEDGLRTLMLAVRELSQAEFNSWFATYQKAAASIHNRAEAIAEAAENVERDLLVVGTTAIEDKLQEEVPQTIADTLDAGIKVWVLTGDKMETAINIGYSCRLLSSRMALLKLKDTGNAETIRRHLKKLLNSFEWLIEQERRLGDTLGRRIMERMTQCSRKGMNFRSSWQAGEEDIKIMEDPDLKICYQPQLDAPHFKQLTSDTVALVVDGPALVHIFGIPEYEAMFLRLSSICRSVVACRVSPAQKRMIVRLVKDGVHPRPITLSIGDGANDVAMIQEAQIGVGISGKEGTQAVNSADFAIAQFRFLKPLLLKHGRYDYRRMSKVILYSFYKNIVLTFILFYYLFFTGFSGQSLFEDWIYSGYNFFLAMPIICVGFFDLDIRPDHVAQWKWVYMSGRDHMDLNVRLMAQWFMQAVVDSVLLFCICLFANGGPRGVWGGADGDTVDLFIFGTTVYSCMFLAMMYKVATCTYTWTRVSWFFFIGSILLYLIFIFCYAALPASLGFFNVPVHMMRMAPYWLLVVMVPFVSVAIDYCIISVKLAIWPSPVDIAVEKSNMLANAEKEKKRRDSKAAAALRRSRSSSNMGGAAAVAAAGAAGVTAAGPAAGGSRVAPAVGLDEEAGPSTTLGGLPVVIQSAPPQGGVEDDDMVVMAKNV